VSTPEPKPSFLNHPNNTHKAISYAPYSSEPTTLTQPDGETLFFGHDAKGKLEVISGEGVELKFSYDLYERLKSIKTHVHHTELGYNVLSEVQSQTQDGIEVRKERIPHTYNTTLSFLDQSIQTQHHTEKNQTLIVPNEEQNKEILLSYDLKTKTQTISYPNHTQETYTFNAAKELIALQSADQRYSYQRDALGRITKLTNNTESTYYHYDVIGRLTQATSAGSVTDFEYDKAGNNLHKQSLYNTALNQIQEDKDYTYTYDERGNLKRKVDKQTNEMYFYRYNTFNQLVEHYKATDKDTYLYRMFFTYDGFGRRCTKELVDYIDNTQTYYHNYLYDNENIIAILNEERNILATIVHHPTQTDTPLSITNHTTNQTYYYHRDHQGSIVALTNQEGKVVERIEYDGHYGSILNHTQEEETYNIYGYTGRETDQSYLYYYRARYYDPTMQSFLSRDPIEFEAGDFNFYRYVGNDPVNFRDPSGLWATGSPSVGYGMTSVVKGIADFFAGMGKFFTNYKNMRTANTIGADKYFHCLANCQATNLGTGGSVLAHVMSEGRELTDEYQVLVMRIE